MDKACKSNGFRPMADEVVTRRNVPQSRAYSVERRCNSRWSQHFLVSVLAFMAMFYVYMLKSGKTRSLYIGVTNNLRRRFSEHNSERASREFTQRHKPWKLVYYEAYLNEQDAHDREAALKKYGASLGQLRKRVKRSLESAG